MGSVRSSEYKYSIVTVYGIALSMRSSRGCPGEGPECEPRNPYAVGVLG